jgi:hypothetical protein
MPNPPALSLSEAVADRVQSLLAPPATPNTLNSALRHLAKWRSELVANTVVARDGAVVQSGPFRGMAYPVRASEGSRVARLFGGLRGLFAPGDRDDHRPCT